MSAKPHVCPICRERPKPMRRWHDKHNRVFNHLKWQVECARGCISVMAGYRAEAVSLFNASAAHKKELLMQQPTELLPKASTGLRKIWRLLLWGQGGAA